MCARFAEVKLALSVARRSGVMERTASRHATGVPASTRPSQTGSSRYRISSARRQLVAGTRPQRGRAFGLAMVSVTALRLAGFLSVRVRNVRETGNVPCVAVVR